MSAYEEEPRHFKRHVKDSFVKQSLVFLLVLNTSNGFSAANALGKCCAQWPTRSKRCRKVKLLG